MPHTLQLAVNKGLKIAKVQKNYCTLQGNCQPFQETNKEDTECIQIARKVKIVLMLPQHMLVQDCITSWGSTLSMLQRLIEQQMSIQQCWLKGRTGI